jgi:hypothetical protein
MNIMVLGWVRPYPRQGVAAIKRGDEEKRLRFDDSPRLRAPRIESLPLKGVAEMSILAGIIRF